VQDAAFMQRLRFEAGLRWVYLRQSALNNIGFEMPALDWISISGFKSLRNIEKLSLGKINVIIGANGSGKSNFISSFAFLHAIHEGRLEETVKRAGGADEILHYGSKETQTVKFHLSFEDERNQYEIDLLADEQDNLVPLNETAYFWDKARGFNKPYSESIFSAGLEAGISRQQQPAVPHYVRRHLAKWRLYHFHDTSSTSPLKKTAKVNDNRYLRSDGANLASFLYLLKQNHPDNYNRIISSIRSVAPFFQDFVLEPLELNPDSINLEWREVSHDKYMSPSAFSDGTLRFIALCTLLLQPEIYIPSIILIDEPELGLHPFALAVLASLVRFASNNSQIIISTQSAFLLDNFLPEDVLVADRVEGATTLNRLDTSLLSDWLEDYSLGQLWEKAELGGRPR
jgi:predicted ATPase